MEKVEIREKVKKVLFEHFYHWIGKEENIKPESSLVDDLGFDSLGEVEFVMILEKEFGILIPDEKAEKIKTVEDAVDIVCKIKEDNYGK